MTNVTARKPLQLHSMTLGLDLKGHVYLVYDQS